MEHRNYQMGNDQTGDIAMTIEDALKERQDIVTKLTRMQADTLKLLRELCMGVYVRGFFAGMRHTMMDNEEKTKGPTETQGGRKPCKS